MKSRFGQVVGVLGVACILVGAASFAAWKAPAQEPERNWQDLCRRTVAAESRIRDMERTIDELQVLILWGSAKTDRRLQALETGTRPIIQIERGTVYGGGRELVVQKVEDQK